MQTTVRTTVRIRKDLLDQSRMLALIEGVSLQEIINNVLTLGFGKISNVEINRQSMNQIDMFRNKLYHKKINIEELLKVNKLEQK